MDDSYLFTYWVMPFLGRMHENKFGTTVSYHDWYYTVLSYCLSVIFGSALASALLRFYPACLIFDSISNKYDKQPI